MVVNKTTPNSHWILQKYQTELCKDGDPFFIIDGKKSDEILFELLVPVNFTNEWANLHGVIVGQSKDEYVEWMNVNPDDSFARFVDHQWRTIHCTGRMVIELREKMFQDNASFFNHKKCKQEVPVSLW